MITKEEIIALGYTWVGSQANGGTISLQKGVFDVSKRRNPEQNKPPFYMIEYNGLNGIYKRESDPRLLDIEIRKLEIGTDEKKTPIWTTLYLGKPENIAELKQILITLNLL